MTNVQKLLDTNDYIEETSFRIQALEDALFRRHSKITFQDAWGDLVCAVSFGEAALINFLEEGTQKSESQIVKAFIDARAALEVIQGTGFESKELLRLQHTVNDVLATYDRVSSA